MGGGGGGGGARTLTASPAGGGGAPSSFDETVGLASSLSRRLSSPSRFQNGVSRTGGATLRSACFASPRLMSSKTSSALNSGGEGARVRLDCLPVRDAAELGGVFSSVSSRVFSSVFAAAASFGDRWPATAASTFLRSFLAFVSRSAKFFMTRANRSGSSGVFLLVLAASSP